MAYKTTVAKYCANRQAALDEIYTQMPAMGWTLVDGNFSPITVSYTAVNISDETFTTTSGSVPANATPCQITSTGTVPTGLAVNTLYYVVNRTDTTFKLSTTYNGAAINITAQGTGNHTIKEAVRVYKSNGENSNKIYEYIYINSFGSNTVTYFWPIYYWNTTTKAVGGQTYASMTPDVTTSESGFYLWIYGNKNLVFIGTKITSTYDKMIFGHMNKTMLDLVTTTSGAITAGTGVPVTVGSTVGFDLTSNYQIIVCNGEGRDPLTLNSIDSPTQFTITSVARNYDAGAQIGICPSTFGGINGGAVTNWYFTCPQQVVGLTACTNNSYGSLASPPKDILGGDPDWKTNKYLLQPIWIASCTENASANVSIGYPYNDEYLLLSSQIGLTQEDTFSYNVLNTGTSSGSNNSTTLNDSAKSWVTNAYAGKVVVITGGIGVGQIKKIASNTGTALTLDTGWTFEVVPTTSAYIICDEAYRYLFSASSIGVACREGC
jgi:hypothetical protein